MYHCDMSDDELLLTIAGYEKAVNRKECTAFPDIHKAMWLKWADCMYELDRRTNPAIVSEK